MTKWMDRTAVRVAVCVAGSLMFGALLAVWQRVLDAVTGRTVYSVAACVCAVTMGVAAGYFLAGWPCRKFKQPAVLLRLAFLLLGGWLVFQLAAVAGVTGGWQRLLNDLSRSFLQYGLALGKTAAFFFLVPSVLVGVAVRAALAAVRSCAAPRPHGGGQQLTLVVLLGVLPASAGYGFAAGALVPWLGVEGTMRMAALWFGALASLVMLRGFLSSVPFAVVIGLVVALNPRERASVLTDGVYSRLVHRDSGFAQGNPVFVHHSRHHTVTAYEDPDYQFVFALDGRPVLFGNRFHTARTLTGYIPLLVQPSCRKVAVFGPEAGLYLPFFVRAGITNVAYAGSDAAVVKLALAADGHVAGGEDGASGTVRRGATLSPKEGYDLVFLAPEPVWMRGTRGAYGRGLFKRCREALSADGVAALHLDARALSLGRFASIARTFTRVFASVQVWQTGAHDWLLVGRAKKVGTPMDGMLGLFEKLPVVRDLARAGVRTLPEVLACWVCDDKGLAVWLGQTKPESAGSAAWRAPRAVFENHAGGLDGAALAGCRQKKLEWVLPGQLDRTVFEVLHGKSEACLAARAVAVTALAQRAKGQGEPGLTAAREAAKVNPRDVLLIDLAEAMELEGRRRIAIGDFKGALKCYENLLSFSPGTARAHYGLAYCLRASGDNETAYLHFARAVSAAPGQTGYRMELAQVALAVGEYAEADRQYQEVLKREPSNPEPLFRYAKGLAVKERPDKDLAKAVKLAERACVLTRFQNSEYAFGLADLYMDAGRVLEGMGLKRRIKEGHHGR